MYLKRMELQGFKSFADRTVLEFKPGITSVIGPNGSGKSNISDAIRWVLGEQSMKSLRGAKSEDVIFAGTQARKSLGFAEVSIVIDNSDGKLPIEYTEVTVTRKIYRSGETGYFINKTPCRLKDIVELFMDTGIGKDGYSIIGQGKIDEILSNKSEDRRHIFEEAAGIVKYRVRKQDSEKKLEQTKLNLLRINDILSEIESSIEPLKEQAEKARKYLDLREELKLIEVGLFIHNINVDKEKLEQIIKDVEILNEQNNNESLKMEKFQSEKASIKQRIDEIIQEIEEKQNLGFESTNKIEKINSVIGIAKERIQNNQANKERLEKEIETANEKINELEQEKKQKLDKKESLNTSKEKYVKELEEKEKELSELSSKLTEKEKEIEDKKQIVESNTDKRYELTSDINVEKQNYENLEKRERNVSLEIQDTISELDSKRDEKQQLSQGFYEIEDKRNKTSDKLKNIVEQKENAMQKVKDFDDEINKLTYEVRMKDSRHKFLVETEREKEGYIKSVRSLLLDCEKNAELKKGMHGILANLINVPKDYEIAIEMALGQALQNIVTQTEDDAKKLVAHLREHNLGRASFLPITSVRGKKLDKLVTNGIDGVIGIASDLVKYDKKYEQIVYSLLGRTVIVDSMDTGIALSKLNNYTFRVVTVKGDIINSSGAITGGSIAQKTVNILGRSREIEELAKEVENLQKQIKNKTAEKEKYSSSIADVIEETAKLDKELQDIEVLYATEKQKMLSIENEITRLQDRLNKLKEEKTTIETQKENSVNVREEKKKQIDTLSKEIDELNVVIKEFAELNKDNQKYIDDLNFDITNLKISVSSFDESKNSIDELVERIENDIENSKASITNKQETIETTLKETEDLEKQIENLENQIEEIKRSIENSSGDIEKLKNERAEKNSKLNAVEQDIENQFSVIDGLKEQLVKIDIKKTKVEEEIQSYVDELWNEYEITPNTAKDYKIPENVSQTQKQVNELRSRIKDLGSINIDSIEEYKKLKDRYDFMNEQRLDLEDTMTKLRKVISEMTETMKKQFKEKFEIINKNFNEVFIELFGGGKAELILEDENNILECGIDIQVQPTGKKLQNMLLLSGGERAFTAIALLFAILKINPAPFCILDEIEAALDDVNVYRFAEYLKKFSKTTQFLVITHRKGTMEAADSVYGVTMEENGISKLLSMKLQ